MRMRTIALAGALLAGIGPAHGQGIMDGGGQTCETGLPVKGDVVVLSRTGDKGAPVPYMLTGANDKIRAVSVTGSGSGPVTLVLTSYNPTVWDLRAIAPRVKAVLAYGYDPQAIAGLGESVPIKFMGNPKQGSAASACGMEYVSGEMYKIQEQARAVQTMIGAHPRRWYGGEATSFDIDGGEGARPAVAPPIDTLRASTTVKTGALLPDRDGLRQLVAAGIIRQIDKQDVNAWAAKGGRLTAFGRMSDMLAQIERAGHSKIDELDQGSEGYLVLKSLKAFPSGLGGANSVIFIVPDGIATPDEAGHSAMFRLTGYPGIPRASGRVVRSHPWRAMVNADTVYAPARLSVEWNAAGEVTKDGTNPSPDGMPFPRPVVTSQTAPPPLLEHATIEPLASGASVNEEDASRDMTPSALAAALLFACGGAGLFLTRRRGVDPFAGLRHRGLPEMEPTLALAQAMPAIETVVSDPETADEVKQVSASLQEAIDLAHEDDTALGLLRFKRTMLRALEHPDYDDDLAAELNAIIENHLPGHVGTYLKAARRISGARTSVIEANLTQGVGRLTRRIDEIIEEQSSRDEESLRRHGDFLRRRHSTEDGFGDQA